MADLHARLLAAIDESRDTAEWGCGCGSLTDALRAAVEHHAPELFGGIWACLACSPGMPPQILISAPCSTIRVIAEQLGVEIEDKSFTEKESPTDG